jgi:hypothetical protein
VRLSSDSGEAFGWLRRARKTVGQVHEAHSTRPYLLIRPDHPRLLYDCVSVGTTKCLLHNTIFHHPILGRYYEIILLCYLYLFAASKTKSDSAGPAVESTARLPPAASRPGPLPFRAVRPKMLVERAYRLRPIEALGPWRHGKPSGKSIRSIEPATSAVSTILLVLACV